MFYQNLNEELVHEVEDILAYQQLNAFYQPIVNFVEQKIFGYECFLGGPPGPLHHPFVLFQVAKRSGYLSELETLRYQFAIKKFQELQLEGKLLLNFSLSALLNPHFSFQQLDQFLQTQAFNPTELIIGLVQNAVPKNFEKLKEILKHLQQQGFSLAFDNLSTHCGCLRLWMEVKPDFVKIDKPLIEKLHLSSTKKHFIRTFQDLSRHLNTQIIIQGIETLEELEALVELDIHLGQGNYFSPVQAIPPKNLPLTLFNYQQRDMPALPPGKTVDCLVVEVPSVFPTEKMDTIADIFHESPSLQSIPVVSPQRMPVGILHRQDLMHIFLNRYGRELHGRKPISQFMDKEPLIFDIHTLLEDVSRQITSNQKIRPDQSFIITDQGVYIGIGQMTDLLRKITDMQIRNARYANPLTLLPGNVPIYEHLDEVLKNQLPFAIGYCDLDNFKPFNDVYGYDKGDLVIQAVAEILVACTDSYKDFVGHIGGDDFILILQSYDWQMRCQTILDSFESSVPNFYNDNDRQHGGIYSVDRHGNESFFPMLSLSIGLITPNITHHYSHHDIASLATEAKKQAKKQVGNSIFIDQRSGRVVNDLFLTKRTPK